MKEQDKIKSFADFKTKKKNKERILKDDQLLRNSDILEELTPIFGHNKEQTILAAAPEMYAVLWAVMNDIPEAWRDKVKHDTLTVKLDTLTILLIEDVLAKAEGK